MNKYKSLLNKCTAHTNVTKALSDNSGCDLPNGMIYTPPTAERSEDVKDLFRTLNAYELDPTDKNLKKLDNLLKKLNMSAYKFEEYPDVVMFYPNKKEEPGVTFFWRFGKVQIPNKPDTYNNPVQPSIISIEHEKKDKTLGTAITLFFGNLNGEATNAKNSKFVPKCLVANLINPESKSDRSECQDKRRMTDAAHSLQVCHADAMQVLLNEIFPYATLINPHGVRNLEGLELIIANNFNSQFLKNGERSWPLLFAIAFAKYQNAPLPIDDPNRIRQPVTIGSFIPGNIVINKKKYPLSNNDNNINTIYVRHTKIHNTNIPGHLSNGDGCNLKSPQKDRSMHIEFNPAYRAQPNGPKMKKLISALGEAMYMYVRYDKKLHNPWTLQETKPKVYNDMSLYGTLFDTTPTLTAINTNDPKESNSQILTAYNNKPKTAATTEKDQNQTQKKHNTATIK